MTYNNQLYFPLSNIKHHLYAQSLYTKICIITLLSTTSIFGIVWRNYRCDHTCYIWTSCVRAAMLTALEWVICCYRLYCIASSAAIVAIEAHQCPCDTVSLFFSPNNSRLYCVVIRCSTIVTDLLAKKAHCTHSQDNNGRWTTSFIILFHLFFPESAVYLCFWCTANMVPSSLRPLSP